MSTHKSNSSEEILSPHKTPPEIIKTSFVERLVMAFIKRVLFGGLKVLKDKNNIFWGGITLILILTTGIIAILFILPNYYSEVPFLVTETIFQTFIHFQVLVAISFLLVALLRWIGVNTKWSMIVTGFFIILSAMLVIYFIYLQNSFLNISPDLFGIILKTFWTAMFIIWIFIIAVSPFIMAREFFTGLTGKTMWLGASEGRILFGEILKIVFLASFGILVLALFRVLVPTSDALPFLFDEEKFLFLGIFAFIWIIMLYWLFFSNNKLNYVFVTTLAVYYVYSLYHFFLAASPQLSNISSLLDIVIALVMTLFAVQANAKRIEGSTKKIEALPDYGFTKRQLGLLLCILAGALATWSFALSIFLNPIDGGPRVFSFILHRTQTYFVAFVIIGLTFVFIFLPQYRYVLNYHMSDAEAIKKIWELIREEIAPLQRQIITGAAKAIATAPITRTIDGFLKRWARKDENNESNEKTNAD
ncbi:MAG: hypothetical protein ACFFC7_05200 [Candidatus Hermodarchaeota archaeon]